MIEASEGTAASPALHGCPWLDETRGPSGSNVFTCRLTAIILGPADGSTAPCLRTCGYPVQHARGRCRNMNLANIILTKDGQSLPRVHCTAHQNYDAPSRCGSCRDYAPA